VISMLRTASAGQGNLLLNIGPKPDGSVPEGAAERLIPVGKWLEQNGEAVYGQVDRVENVEWVPTGNWSRKGNIYYFWCHNWPGKELAIGGLKTKLKKASFLVSDQPIEFEQTEDRLVLKGLPEKSPDSYASVAVIKMEFESEVRQVLGAGYVVL